MSTKTQDIGDDDEAEPTPDSVRKLRVATCHHCEETIAINEENEWEHIHFTGTLCD
jgi:hypothetical protein